MKKLIMASAFLAALCLPALACGGPGNPCQGNQGDQGGNHHGACPGRSSALGFRFWQSAMAPIGSCVAIGASLTLLNPTTQKGGARRPSFAYKNPGQLATDRG